MSKKKNRLGEIRESNNCGLMEIVEYSNINNIKVKFKTGTVLKTNYTNFCSGQIKDHSYPSIYNKGYIGKGTYKCWEDGKLSIEYDTWRSMIRRCYDPYALNKHPTYRNVIVCKSWLNFQNFAEWMTQHYYELPENSIHLDKDLIKEGNKIYHPKLCSFVPQSINKLLITNTKHKKSKLPTGVYFDRNMYVARIKIAGKQTHIGVYTTAAKAFFAYKTEKEKYVKIEANKYKDVLHPRVYKYLMQYEVVNESLA